MDTIYTHEPDKSCHGKYLQGRPAKLRFSGAPHDARILVTSCGSYAVSDPVSVRFWIPETSSGNLIPCNSRRVPSADTRGVENETFLAWQSRNFVFARLVRRIVTLSRVHSRKVTLERSPPGKITVLIVNPTTSLAVTSACANPRNRANTMRPAFSRT